MDRIAFKMGDQPLYTNGPLNFGSPYYPPLYRAGSDMPLEPFIPDYEPQTLTVSFYMENMQYVTDLIANSQNTPLEFSHNGEITKWRIISLQINTEEYSFPIVEVECEEWERQPRIDRLGPEPRRRQSRQPPTKTDPTLN